MYLLPLLLFYVIYNIIPLGMSLYYSITNFSGFGAYEFVGLKNFAKVLTDKWFWGAFRNTLVYTLMSMVIILPLSFMMAMVIQKGTKKTALYRTFYFLPCTLGGSIVGLIWRFILDPNVGFLNIILRELGVNTANLLWIGGQTLAPVSFTFVNVWVMSGFCMMLWSGGLKQLPGDILEASVIDGVTKTQQIFKVILPNMRSTIRMMFIYVFTTCLKLFEYVFILTGGGPNHASESLISYLYVTMFENRLYGYGSAIAVIELLFAIIGALIIIRLTQRKEDFE